MTVGIYGRKSIYSDKSDSVDNQIKYCKDYIDRVYPGSTIIVYDRDEGFSGGTDERPSFKQMMRDVENGILNMIICYKIDRFSRNVSDFSKYFDILQNHKVEFVSATENIDTSTPLGRAMMYICSVFAQMERENIADRVKDNMVELAKSGKWAGGNPPLGLKRVKINVNGKTHTSIIPCEEEIPLLNKIYDTFLEGHSLSAVETIFRKNSILSPSGKRLVSTQIYQILSNPHYVNNSSDIYDYFEQKGCIMSSTRDEFDGRSGVVVYGRTSGSRHKKHVKNPPDKWIVATGDHKAIIDSKKWLAVQLRFGKNIINKEKKHHIGLLDGALRCKCGGLIKVKHKYDKVYEKTYNSYFCYNRSRYNSCDMAQIGVNKLDDAFIKILKEISLDKNKLNSLLKNQPIINKYRKKSLIEKDISLSKGKIDNLTAALHENYHSTASKYIITEIEKIDSKINTLQRELLEAEVLEKESRECINNFDTVYSNIKNMIGTFDDLSYHEKTNFIRDNFECIWDGLQLSISLK